MTQVQKYHTVHATKTLSIYVVLVTHFDPTSKTIASNNYQTQGRYTVNELSVNEIKNVNGGVVPFFVAFALYGELAVFAGTISGMMAYNSLK